MLEGGTTATAKYILDLSMCFPSFFLSVIFEVWEHADVVSAVASIEVQQRYIAGTESVLGEERKSNFYKRHCSKQENSWFHICHSNR